MTLDAARRAGPPMVCPFVAFADDRDQRAARPDPDHRCYADVEPSPRAFAHQERYCLSPGFTSCPTFQDWAARSAADVSETDEPAPVLQAATGGSGLFDADEHGAAAFAGGGAGGSGGAAGRPGAEAGPRRAGEGADGSGGRGGDTQEWAEEGPRVAPWSRPRRRERYPRLRRTAMGVPPLLMAVVALGIAAVALFLLPTILTSFFGGGGVVSTPSPTPTAIGTPTAPTATPAPTGLVYVVQQGDTLSKIAQQFGMGLDELIAANPQIEDPNKIAIGDQINIPTPSPAPGEGGSPAPTETP